MRRRLRALTNRPCGTYVVVGKAIYVALNRKAVGMDIEGDEGQSAISRPAGEAVVVGTLGQLEDEGVPRCHRCF